MKKPGLDKVETTLPDPACDLTREFRVNIEQNAKSLEELRIDVQKSIDDFFEALNVFNKKFYREIGLINPPGTISYELISINPKEVSLSEHNGEISKLLEINPGEGVIYTFRLPEHDSAEKGTWITKSWKKTMPPDMSNQPYFIDKAIKNGQPIYLYEEILGRPSLVGTAPVLNLCSKLVEELTQPVPERLKMYLAIHAYLTAAAQETRG